MKKLVERLRQEFEHIEAKLRLSVFLNGVLGMAVIFLLFVLWGIPTCTL